MFDLDDLVLHTVSALKFAGPTTLLCLLELNLSKVLSSLND